VEQRRAGVAARLGAQRSRLAAVHAELDRSWDAWRAPPVRSRLLDALKARPSTAAAGGRADAPAAAAAAQRVGGRAAPAAGGGARRPEPRDTAGPQLGPRPGGRGGFVI